MKDAIVYFDGVCNFCNGIINFILRNDREGYFRFTPLQSERGQKFLQENHFPTQKLETFYLQENGKIYSHSTAVLRVLRRLGWKFSWTYGFIIVPSFVRDFVYGIISKNRYRWFGKKERCMIPRPGDIDKFLL